MNNVHNLLDDMAYVCDCGSVKFNFLKSKQLECIGCGTRKEIDSIFGVTKRFDDNKILNIATHHGFQKFTVNGKSLVCTKSSLIDFANYLINNNKV